MSGGRAEIGLEDDHALAGHPVMGASWEGFVIENLLAVAPSRTAAGAEIDLVLDLPGRSAPWAVEVKRSLSPRLARGFHHALDDLQPERAFVVYAGTDRYPMSGEVEAVGLREMAALVNTSRADAPRPAV